MYELTGLFFLDNFSWGDKLSVTSVDHIILSTNMTSLTPLDDTIKVIVILSYY